MKNYLGIGKPSEKRKAKVLGPLLTLLLGGTEGTEMIVDASDSALPAIDAAELTLEMHNQQGATLMQEKEAAETAKAEAQAALATAEAALEAEKTAHANTTAAFDKLKEEPGADSTVVEHSGDAYTGGAPESVFRQHEAAAKAEGAKITKHVNK